MVIVLVFYTSLSIPFNLAFDNLMGHVALVLDYVIDFIFIADVILHFMTAFIDEDRL